jgi:NADH-quinone oxidoreductase subunit G/NADP-reducing hydrogenase subunit HndD
MNFPIEVNNKTIVARRGETILEALDRNGIKVPTLCHMQGLYPTGSCRMCVVEVEGKPNLITACSYPVEEWMKIRTHSPRVVNARKTNVELLLSNHPDDCLYCERNGNCELQSFAEQLNVRTCEEIIGAATLGFIGRGNTTIIGPAFNKQLNLSSCITCGQCIMACPTGALHEKRHSSDLQNALHNKDIHVVMQYSPTIAVSLAEEFGLKAGKEINGLLNAALRKTGFDKVFDSTFGADIYIMELAAELEQRLKNNLPFPLFSSDCPAWIKYVEQWHPELIPQVTTCKSPQQMLGAIISEYYTKTYHINIDNLYTVSAMPCTAKKFEAQREQMTHKGISDVDAVLTTRELAQFIRLNGIDIHQGEPELADFPFHIRSSAGKLFSVSGGVTEALIRTLHFRLTGKELQQIRISELRSNKDYKEVKLKIGEFKLGFAAVSTVKQAAVLIEEIRNGRNDLHFIEVMACPGGCVNGGGQPIVDDQSALKARIKAVYDLDEKEPIRVAHKNPAVIELYKEFLGEPLGELSMKLLHTSYKKRDVSL